MTTTAQHVSTEPYVLNRDEGRHHHFINHLATTKVASESTGSMGVVEFRARRDFGPPVHQHDHEDELIVVLDGEIAFQTGDREIRATAGACAFLPHGVPHCFQVLSDEARFVAITASATTRPRFDAFVAAVGTATAEATMPEPGPVDPERLATISEAHGIAVVGPPPAPRPRS
ncbi:MAG: cupin domain-containing protein [Actinomycetota bacterium]